MKMNKIGFKVILVVVFAIVLAVPIFIFIGMDNNDKKYEGLIKQITIAAENYVVRNQMIIDSNGVKVKLGKLKDTALMPINLKNPKTKAHLSNESYVIVSSSNGKYQFDVKLYDIPKKETSAGLFTTINGSKQLQLGISARYEEPGVTVYEGTIQLEYSAQYFLKGEEVTVIDSSRPKTFDVVYTAINSEGEVAKVVRNVVVQ